MTTTATSESPRPWPVQECRSPRCKQPIIWTLTERGRDMPVDAEPSKGGNVALRWNADGDTVMSSVPKPHLAFGRHDLHMSHFATCPDAYWRAAPRGGG